jgi:hypothetical protein
MISFDNGAQTADRGAEAGSMCSSITLMSAGQAVQPVCSREVPHPQVRAAGCFQGEVRKEGGGLPRAAEAQGHRAVGWPAERSVSLLQHFHEYGWCSIVGGTVSLLGWKCHGQKIPPRTRDAGTGNQTHCTLFSVPVSGAVRCHATI